MGKTTDLTAALQKYFQKEGAADRVAALLPAMTALGHQRRDLPKLQTDNVKACDAMFCYLKHLQVWLYHIHIHIHIHMVVYLPANCHPSRSAAL
jgi:hypothetical protein